MQGCDAFIAFGTRDYGESTGNPAATDQELFFWQNYMEKKGKALVPRASSLHLLIDVSIFGGHPVVVSRDPPHELE